jgi:NADPH oxidase 1
MAPQTGCILYGILGCDPHLGTLCQLYERGDYVRSCLFSQVHTILTSFGNSEVRKQTAVQIHYTQPGGITGHFMLLIMVLMYTTAQKEIRQQSFETFWYTHHLAFFFMLALYTHATGCFVRDTVDPDFTKKFPFYSTDHCLGYESWRFIATPGIAYFLERLYRVFRARRPTKLDRALVHPSGLLNERFAKVPMLTST